MRRVVIRMDIDEMPTACGPCKLSCTAICKEWTKVDRKEIGRTKSPNCPILAILPEGHGDLVDSEEDVSKYITIWDCNCSEFGRQTVMAVEDLQYLPIIVPAERSE